MNRYSVDLTLIPIDEREAAYEYLHAYGEFPIDTLNKSGIAETVVVGWNDTAPFPGGIKIPPNCWRAV